MRGRLWFDHALWRSGLSPTDFERVYIRRGRSVSNLVAKWRAGTVLPNRASAVALERLLPDTLWLFDLPLFALLVDEPISRRTLERLTDGLRGESWIGTPEWRLPALDHNGTTAYRRSDPRALVHRGDFWGLCALIGTVRWMELEGDFPLHIEASQDAFRALPALLREPWAATSIRPLYKLIERIRVRMPYSRVLYQVTWETIEALAARPSFEADPARRPKTPNGQFETYPDPVITMRFVPAKPQQAW